MTFRIITLNCWGGRLFDDLLRFVDTVEADIICLQEVYSAPPGTPSPLVFEDGIETPELPPYPRLFQALEERLGARGFGGQFLPAAHGFLHDRATTEYPVEYGLATFVRTDHSIIEQHVGFVSGSFRTDRWVDPPLPRNAHCIRVWRADTGRMATIAHMHGLWVPEGKRDTPERIEQAKRLVEMIKMIFQNDDDLVVCGDFNILPESETFRILFEEFGLRDLVVGHQLEDTRTSYYKKNPRFADYMLVSRQTHYIGFQVIKHPEVSDHRPLTLEM